MGLRELKETAHQQFVRGKFAQCAQTYQQILRQAPRDPNMHVRHAEACRRSGERLQAIASYRTAAGLLLELGCASRARGALKAALELDPKDSFLQSELARLDSIPGEPLAVGASAEQPLLPALESGVDSSPHPSAPSAMRATRPEERLRTPTLPPIHRALPSAQHIGPPILLPPPGGRVEGSAASPGASEERVVKLGADMASAAVPVAPVTEPRAATPTYRALPPRAKAPPPAPRQVVPSGPPPVLHPVDQGPTPGSTGLRAAALGDPASNLRAASVASAGRVPPPPPVKSLIEAVREVPRAQASSGGASRLEVRRLSPSAVAFRSSPQEGWTVIRSHTPLELHQVKELEQLPPLMQDLPTENTVGSEGEGAYSALH